MELHLLLLLTKSNYRIAELALLVLWPPDIFVENLLVEVTCATLLVGVTA